LIQNFANSLNIDESRINITQRPNEENKNREGELIISISKTTGTEMEHASAIYEISHILEDKPKVDGLFLNTNINPAGAKSKILTFNETVGTTPGCFIKDSSASIGALFIGKNDQCNPLSSNNIVGDSPMSNLSMLIIGVVIGVIASVVIVAAILISIPGTRKIIFPYEKKKKATPRTKK